MRFEAYAHKKILMEGLDGIAVSLTHVGTRTSIKHMSVPAALPKIVLQDNSLCQYLASAIVEAKNKTSGGCIIPHLSNFPAIHSAFTSVDSTIQFQMKVE